MELIARIDGNGRAFIGKFGRDDKWVKKGNTRPVTIVRNEKGGENVSPEDIAYAQMRHKIQNAGQFYAEQDVMDFCISD